MTTSDEYDILTEDTVGLSREEELENILGEIVDMFDMDELIPASLMEGEVEVVEEVMDRARQILTEGGAVD